MVKHFLGINDFSTKDILAIFDLARKLKNELKQKGHNKPLLDRRTLAMIFEKPSLRTRVSFETGMTQLGGHAIYLGPADIQLGKRESASDAGKNLCRMANIIIARVFDHNVLLELASGSSVPVINALSDLEHPCQAMADVLTIMEYKKILKGLKLAYVGDGENNVTHSLALLCDKVDISFACGSPKGYEMKMEVINALHHPILQSSDPIVAVANADVVVTDTWVSMGDETEKKKRFRVFPPYQVNKKLMNKAKPDAIFMHCLPAYRGFEVTDEVIDGPQSVVFDEAENRLHVQKALMLYLLKDSRK